MRSLPPLPPIQWVLRLVQGARHRAGTLPTRLRSWRNGRGLWLRQKRVVAGVMLCLTLGAVLGSVLWTHSRPAKAGATAITGSTITISGFVTFLDTLDRTSFTVQTNLSGPSAGVFSFGTPSGAVYHGGLAGDITVNGAGILNLHFDGTVQVFSAPAADGSATLSTAQVHVNAVLNTVQHQATAEISDDTNQQQYVMVSQAPPSASDVVNATIQATINQDWATLYGLCASELLGGMTEAQFAQLMTQQTQTLGSVVAVVVITAPVVSYSDSGITTFSVGEQVTISLNGTTQTTSSTAYYILEDGAWKLITTTPT